MVNPTSLQITQFKAFDVGLQQMHRILQQRIAENMQREIEAIRDRYGGASLAPIENQINELYARKLAIADTVSQLEGSFTRITSVRNELAELRSLAQEGSVAGFNAKYIYLNSEAGSRVVNDDNIVGRLGNGRWTEETRIIDAGSIEVTVSTNYIGNGWAIDLDSGETLVPDHEEGTLSGGGVSLDMADLTLVSRDGDDVTFSDGTNTYTGTLRRGGGGVLSPWLYNDFATEADREEAMADISAAMSRLTTIERDYRYAESFLTASLNGVETRMDDLNDKYERLQEEELDERSAAIKAVQTRYSMMEKSFALTANTSLALIENTLLAPEVGPQEDSFFDTISGAVGKSFF